MGLMLLGASFLYLCATGHMVAANIAVGAACSGSDKCVDGAVCDKVHGICLKQTDTECSTASEKNCVFGASCKAISGGTIKCQCDAGFTENTKICEANVGTSCNKSVTCVSSSTCDAVFGKCLLEVDSTCNTASGSNCVFGASCKEPTTGNFKCQCDVGFTKNTNTKICEANVGISCNKSVTCVSSSTCDAVFGKCLLKKGEGCSGDNANNCVFGASCKTSCECGDGYTAVTDSKVCDPKNPGTVGTPCTSAGSECTTPNSVCSGLGACKCKAGFLLNIADGHCASEGKGSAAGQASLWVLSATLMAMSMAVYVV